MASAEQPDTPPPSLEPDGAPPQQELNWGIVTLFYLAGCLIGAIFGVLHVREVEAVRGFWLIFAPFPVCLPYAIYQHRRQRLQAAKSGKPKSD